MKKKVSRNHIYLISIQPGLRKNGEWQLGKRVTGAIKKKQDANPFSGIPTWLQVYKKETRRCRKREIIIYKRRRRRRRRTKEYGERGG